MTIAENLRLVRQNIAEAARQSGRAPEDIILVGATKMNDASRVREAVAAGLDACGENRVQELKEKLPQGAYEGVPLHFIGHLQRNKVKDVVGKVALIQSGDSLPLLTEIDRCAAKMGLVQDVLIEINIGREAAKTGFAPEELPAALAAAAQLKNLRVRGLMAIPPVCQFPTENAPHFQQMRQLFIDNSKEKYDNVSMDFLSMGMSGDYAQAVLCGANMVRVGSAVFGPRSYPGKVPPTQT